jgi:hypothetical protein
MTRFVSGVIAVVLFATTASHGAGPPVRLPSVKSLRLESLDLDGFDLPKAGSIDLEIVDLAKADRVHMPTLASVAKDLNGFTEDAEDLSKIGPRIETLIAPLYVVKQTMTVKVKSPIAGTRRDVKLTVSFDMRSVLKDDLAAMKAAEEDIRKVVVKRGYPKNSTAAAVVTTWRNARFDEHGRLRLDRENAGLDALDKKSLVDLFALMGYVEIDSKPKGASIEIKGYYGWEATKDTGYLPEGDVEITLSKDGYQTLVRTETVDPRKRKNEFTYELKPR